MTDFTKNAGKGKIEIKKLNFSYQVRYLKTKKQEEMK